MKSPVTNPHCVVIIFILLFSSLGGIAQHVSVYDKDGKVRSPGDRAVEESRNNRNINTNGTTKSSVPDAEETPRAREQRLDAARKENERKIQESYGKYNFIGLVRAGLRPVRLGDKWGYLDGADNVVVPIQYDELKFADNGFYGVRLNRQWGFVDRAGRVLIPIIYSSLLSGFNTDGVASVTKDYGPKMNIDKNGSPVSDGQLVRMKNGGYDEKQPYYDELALVA
ncbi:MAG TPA: WG repeat-containing protein, partial [Chryseolinea sp.]|nr:WG repeat-containing protein [Chryseolinea sp.]